MNLTRPLFLHEEILLLVLRDREGTAHATRRTIEAAHTAAAACGVVVVP
jgi:hypothetical protein